MLAFRLGWPSFWFFSWRARRSFWGAPLVPGAHYAPVFWRILHPANAPCALDAPCCRLSARQPPRSRPPGRSAANGPRGLPSRSLLTAACACDQRQAPGTPWLRSVVGALLVGLIYAADWDGYLRFAFAQDFGEPDPVFGHDLGFYVFVLPFVEKLQNTSTFPYCNGRSRRRLCPGGKPTVYAGTGDRGPACGYEVISSRTRSCSFWRGLRATCSIATIS